MRALIFGGAGRIGSAVARYLARFAEADRMGMGILGNLCRSWKKGGIITAEMTSPPPNRGI